MKEYYETKRMKSTSYLYYGLVAAAFAALMIVAGILSVVRGTGLWVTVTSFASAVVWGFTSFLSLYVFYSDNRTDLNSDKLDSTEL